MKISKAYRPELVVDRRKKEPNPLLTDPYLDAQEDLLVATDGHALVALPVQTEKGERSRYLACSLLKAARALGDKDVPAEIEDQEVVEFGVLWPTAQERQFPDWKKIRPTFQRGDKGTITIALNARLLRAVSEAMDADQVLLTAELGRSPDDPGPILVKPVMESDAMGLLMPLRGSGEAALDPGQVCPKCGRILAAGAACPEHGPASAPVNTDAPGSGETTVTLTRNGKSVTATQGQMRAALDELERRKAAAAAPPALEWDTGFGRASADLPDGGEFLIEDDGSGYVLSLRKFGTKKPARVGTFKTETEARKHAAAIVAEQAADAILRNAGSGELTKADTKGDAVARKKGRRG